MSALKVGDKFPEGVVFKQVPWTTDDPMACGLPQDYNASKEWADKKVILISVPGAFTPGCQGSHIPPYIEKLQELRGKGVDIVAVIAFNDAFVMNAWQKLFGQKDTDMLFMGDTETKLSEKIGWTIPNSGGRTARYAMVIDHGIVKYAEKEGGPGQVTVSGADAVIAKL